MIESKYNLIGEISTKQSLEGEVNNPIKYLDPVTQEKTVDSSIELQEVTPDKDYTGLSKVTVNPVTNEIDSNIAPENIKQGIDILGVTGNVEEINTTEISIKPSDTEKVVTPEAPYNGFSKVTVGAQSGINPDEYFETRVTSNNSSNFYQKLVLKLPNLTVDNNVTNMSYMFSNLKSIKNVPYFDTSKVTNMSYMFQYTSSLLEVPMYNTSKVTNMSYMFYYSGIIEIPDFDYSNVTNMSDMFGRLSRAVEVPFIYAPKCTNVRALFQYCDKLEIINGLDIPNCTNMSSMCGYSFAIREVKNILNTSNVTTINGMFNSVKTLESICEIDASSVTDCRAFVQGTKPNFTTFGGLKNLGKGYLTTQSENYSFYNFDLSYSTALTHESLMNVINNLYDIASLGVKPQKLTLGSTNLAKLTAEEINLATQKGWNVS